MSKWITVLGRKHTENIFIVSRSNEVVLLVRFQHRITNLSRKHCELWCNMKNNVFFLFRHCMYIQMKKEQQNYRSIIRTAYTIQLFLDAVRKQLYNKKTKKKKKPSLIVAVWRKFKCCVLYFVFCFVFFFLVRMLYSSACSQFTYSYNHIHCQCCCCCCCCCILAKSEKMDKREPYTWIQNVIKTSLHIAECWRMRINVRQLNYS